MTGTLATERLLNIGMKLVRQHSGLSAGGSAHRKMNNGILD